MTKNGLDLYSQWLRSSLDAGNDHEKGLAKENIKNSASCNAIFGNNITFWMLLNANIAIYVIQLHKFGHSDRFSFCLSVPCVADWCNVS